MSTERERRFPGPIRGQILFAAGFFLVAALLLAQVGEQTKWVAGTKVVAQPRFWPALSLAGMVLFGALHLYTLPRRRPGRDDWREGVRWGRSLEWVLWFLAYVWLVPLLGYLPVTCAFAAAMAWRMGYRSGRWLWAAAGFGALVVVVFKSFLQVRIPGAALYEHLPGPLRSFFILNL